MLKNNVLLYGMTTIIKEHEMSNSEKTPAKKRDDFGKDDFWSPRLALNMNMML